MHLAGAVDREKIRATDGDPAFLHLVLSSSRYKKSFEDSVAGSNFSTLSGSGASDKLFVRLLYISINIGVRTPVFQTQLFQSTKFLRVLSSLPIANFSDWLVFRSADKIAIFIPLVVFLSHTLCNKMS